MRLSEIKEIIKKHKEAFEALDIYDRTHVLPVDKSKLDASLDKVDVKKLKKV